MYLFSKKSTPDLSTLQSAPAAQASSSINVPAPEVAIANAHASLARLVDTESDLTGVSLDVLERSNWTASSRYSSLSDTARKVLDGDSKAIQVANEEIQECVQAVDAILEHITDLEALTKEIDEWAREIEVKSRRYKPK